MEQLRDSYLTPAIEETAGDRVVPGRGGGGGGTCDARGIRS